MTDKLLISLSIFLAGLGAGIALVACAVPRSRRELVATEIGPARK